MLCTVKNTKAFKVFFIKISVVLSVKRQNFGLHYIKIKIVLSSVQVKWISSLSSYLDFSCLTISKKIKDF